MQDLDSDRVAFVPIQQNSGSENPQGQSNGEDLADCRDADAEDEARGQNEKESGRTFDRNVRNRNAAVVTDCIVHWLIHIHSPFQIDAVVDSVLVI